MRPGRFIPAGLYSEYSRLIAHFRRLVFRLSADHFQLLDPCLKDKNANRVRKHTWFMDQYKNPHESKHTIGEALRWFDIMGFEFVSSIPKSNGDQFSVDKRLSEVHRKGSKLDHLVVQRSDLLAGWRDGGFFMMIGRKEPQAFSEPRRVLQQKPSWGYTR